MLGITHYDVILVRETKKPLITISDERLLPLQDDGFVRVMASLHADRLSRLNVFA